MSGAGHRRKGNRIERELVQLYKALGIHAERYPLSGASRFRGSGHDLDLYIFGADEAPLIADWKSLRATVGHLPDTANPTKAWRYRRKKIQNRGNQEPYRRLMRPHGVTHH
jgi:hypothetical protein